MGSLLTTDGNVASSLESDPGTQALPNAQNELWAKSAVGPPKTWKSTLNSFASFVTTLPHPGALFWGDELVLIHNEAWKIAADGAAAQGQKQKGTLSDEALSLLRTAMLGKPRQCLQADLFLNKKAQDGRSYQALLSPIMEREEKVASGVLVQLFEMSSQQETQRDKQQGMLQRVHDALSSGSGDNEKIRSDKSLLDDLPLDENPFFQRFAALLPTGMAILNHKAEAVFVNEQFYELTSASGQNFKAWPQSIHPEDYDRVMQAYQESFDAPGKTLTLEFRTIGEEDAWRLLMLSPLGDSRMRDESIEKYGGYVCAVVDITPNKAQELAQKKAAELAMERKEQQERFIDMISHEIRNPLSAVLHCAEEILEIIEPRIEKKDFDLEEPDISGLAESAETIKLCVAHQKNIVDDILSYSKLDATMLSLCPRSVQPKRQIGDSLRMFQPEIKRQRMQLEYVVDTSFDELHIDWVKADLVRVSQILVNLVTNAIKFTSRKEGEKVITCMVGASLERPSSYPPNVVFFDTEDQGFRLDGTNSSDWGNGQALYLLVAVKDTGIGISDENQQKLFQRFRQATPKTEETYGGSGLGLMIARKLCQLHGGEIGVSSIEGEGSTFGFFFRVRRANVDALRSEDQGQMKSEHLLKHVKEVTKGAPIDEEEGTNVDDKFKNPVVTETEEAGSIAKKDAAFEHTASIASHVKQPSGDEYGMKDRPPPSTNPSMASLNKRPSTLEKMQARTDSGGKPARQNGFEKAHVLLVEDNVINQRILKRKLESKRFRVTTANNGREAVDTVKKNLNPEEGSENNPADSPDLFDVILMDQEMPVLDGNAATKEIRRLEGDGRVMRVPILGVTANVREKQRVEMKEAGMDDVISKPYSMEDLIGRIDGLVQHEREGRSQSREANAKEADAG